MQNFLRTSSLRVTVSCEDSSTFLVPKLWYLDIKVLIYYCVINYFIELLNLAEIGILSNNQIISLSIILTDNILYS